MHPLTSWLVTLQQLIVNSGDHLVAFCPTVVEINVSNSESTRVKFHARIVSPEMTTS